MNESRCWIIADRVLATVEQAEDHTNGRWGVSNSKLKSKKRKELPIL